MINYRTLLMMATEGYIRRSEATGKPFMLDIFDLIHLLKHPSYDVQARNKTVELLIKECIISREGEERIQWLFTRQLDKLFWIRNDYYEVTEREIELSWLYWRLNDEVDGMDWMQLLHYPNEVVQKTTMPEQVTDNLNTFADQFYNALEKVGLTLDIIAEHPYMRS